jgi:broad specificity phosphatase PhoE
VAERFPLTHAVVVLRLAEIDAKPGDKQIDDVRRRAIRVQVGGETVQDGHDRVENLLQRTEQAHDQRRVVGVLAVDAR